MKQDDERFHAKANGDFGSGMDADAAGAEPQLSLQDSAGYRRWHQGAIDITYGRFNSVDASLGGAYALTAVSVSFARYCQWDYW